MKKLKKEILRRVPEGMEIERINYSNAVLHSISKEKDVLEVYFKLKEKEVELIKNEWYEIACTAHRQNAVCFYTHSEAGELYFTGFNFAGKWSENISASNNDSIKKANPEKVKELLLEKAKEDYPEGTRVESALSGSIESVGNQYTSYDSFDGVYICSGACLYINGKWAEKAKSRFPDKTPVWCWDDGDIAIRAFRFWDAENDCTFSYAGYRNGTFYDNYKEIKTLEPWMIEMQKKLK
jgi:hypothetical protein